MRNLSPGIGKNESNECLAAAVLTASPTIATVLKVKRPQLEESVSAATGFQAAKMAPALPNNFLLGVQLRLWHRRVDARSNGEVSSTRRDGDGG